MPLNYSTNLAAMFGNGAVITGTGADAELTFKPANTGAANITFDAPENATPEGLFLALLQFVENQFRAASNLTTSPIEISKTSILAFKDGVQVPGEQYVIRIFSDGGVAALDPDNVRRPSSSSSSASA